MTAKTVREAIERSSLTIISALDNQAAREILEDAEPALAGALIVNLSSDTPQRSAQLAKWATEHGARYVSGAILTPSTVIGQDASTALVAGNQHDMNDSLTVLEGIAPRLTLLGSDHALPAAFDIALLSVFWTSLAAWSQSVALAEANGVNAEAISAALSEMVRLAADIGPAFGHDAQTRSYAATTSTIQSASRTMEHVVDAASNAGIDQTLPQAVATLFSTAATGHASDAPSRVFEAIKFPRVGNEEL